MGFAVPFATFAITVGVLLVWGFRAKRKHNASVGTVRPRKAA